METTTVTLSGPVKIYMGDALLLQLELAEQVPSRQWAFPVGNAEYPPARWYAASLHTPSGPTRHLGLDLNLDQSPWGDIERTLGLSVYAIADGVVTYLTTNWSGVPMLIIRHEHNGQPLWVRYAHIVPVVKAGQSIAAGQVLGPFANWRTGDHLHLDMATAAYTREYLNTSIPFIDPVPVLKAHLDPTTVDAMLRKGG